MLSSGVAAGVLSSGVAAGVLSSGVATGVLSSGVATGVLSSGVAAGVLSSGVAAGVLSSGVATGVLSEEGMVSVGSPPQPDAESIVRSIIPDKIIDISFFIFMILSCRRLRRHNAVISRIEMRPQAEQALREVQAQDAEALPKNSSYL